MTKKRGDANSKDDMNITDSENEHLSESSEIRGSGRGDESSSNNGSSSTDGDLDQPLAWRIPPGKAVVHKKKSEEIMAKWGIKRGFLNKGGYRKVRKWCRKP